MEKFHARSERHRVAPVPGGQMRDVQPLVHILRIDVCADSFHENRHCHRVPLMAAGAEASDPHYPFFLGCLGIV